MHRTFCVALRITTNSFSVHASVSNCCSNILLLSRVLRYLQNHYHSYYKAQQQDWIRQTTETTFTPSNLRPFQKMASIPTEVQIMGASSQLGRARIAVNLNHVAIYQIIILHFRSSGQWWYPRNGVRESERLISRSIGVEVRFVVRE